MAERLNLSVDEHTAQRARQCGARFKGGASAYVAKLIRQDEMREAGDALARWYETQGGDEVLEAAESERIAALDEAS